MCAAGVQTRLSPAQNVFVTSDKRIRLRWGIIFKHETSSTVEPLNNRQVGSGSFFLYMEVVLFQRLRLNTVKTAVYDLCGLYDRNPLHG